MRSAFTALLLCFAFLAGSHASASPIDVSYTTTGSAGNWILDFSVTNNLGDTNDVYFFGVKLSSNGVIGSPSGYSQYAGASWNNSFYGGSSTIYNNNWIDGSYGHLFSGQTVSGFEVHVTDVVAPSDIDWFAYAFHGTYTGGGNFNTSTNPGFEGQTDAISVSEPEALLLMAIGLLGIGVAKRRKA